MTEPCFWCKKNCGGTCLGVVGSTQMQTSDPAYFLLMDAVTSTPTVYRDGCYICRDPEYAQMGLPLCKPCPACQNAERGDGHVPADDEECDDCLYNAREDYETQSAGIPWVCDGRPRDTYTEQIAYYTQAIKGTPFIETSNPDGIGTRIHEIMERLNKPVVVHDADTGEVAFFTVDTSPRDESDDPPWEWRED